MRLDLYHLQTFTAIYINGSLYTSKSYEIILLQRDKASDPYIFEITHMGSGQKFHHIFGNFREYCHKKGEHLDSVFDSWSLSTGAIVFYVDYSTGADVWTVKDFAEVLRGLA